MGRLESSVKLASALDSIPLDTNDLQTQMVIFTAAPLIGRWKQFVNVGKVLPLQAFEQFKQVAQNMPVPNYSILFEIAKKERAEEFSTPNPSELPWTQLNVSSIRIKFISLNCGKFIDKQKELLKEIENEENIFWEEIPNPNNIHLRRMGAIYQCISFSETPQQLCGIFRENSIKVRGKTETTLPIDSSSYPKSNFFSQNQISNKNAEILVQEEEWDLKQDVENLNSFKGFYTLHNYTPTKVGEIDSEKEPLYMKFNLEVKLYNVDELLKKKTTG